MTIEQNGAWVLSALAGLLCRYMMRPIRSATDNEPRCGGCGYIVRGLPGPICPECGSDQRRVPVVRGAELLDGKSRAILWTAFVFLSVFVPAGAIWQAWIKPLLPPHFEFDDQRILSQPVSGAYRHVRLVIHGSGFGTPRATRASLSLVRADGGERVMEVKLQTLGYRSTAASGWVAMQSTGLNEEALVAWFAGAGIQPTEAVRDEARVVLATIRSRIDPDQPPQFRGLGGAFHAGGEGSRSSNREPDWYDFVPVVVALLVWAWPVINWQQRWQWAYLRPGAKEAVS